MNITLRILLLFFSILYFGYTIFKVRKASLNIEDAIFPIVFSLLCVFMSIFTKFITYISDKLGFMSVSNFVLVFVILVLSIYNLKIVFYLLKQLQYPSFFSPFIHLPFQAQYLLYFPYILNAK